MTSFLYRAPAGVAGDVTRPDDTIVESGLLNAAQAPTAFGAPVKLVSGKFEKIASGDTAAVFAGVLSRVAPSIAGDLVQTYAGGTPNTASVQGIVVKGYECGLHSRHSRPWRPSVHACDRRDWQGCR